jgi:hypothetical protein
VIAQHASLATDTHIVNNANYNLKAAVW